MGTHFAHLYASAANGGRIDYAVFGARSISGTNHDNDVLLRQLTIKARLNGLKIDQSALAYSESGRVKFYGTPPLVEHLRRTGVPQWTHTLE